MKVFWIFLFIFLTTFAFQFGNIMTFVGIELGVYFGFKEQDKNADGMIQKEEWADGMFSLLDLDGDNLASKVELREFIKEYSHEFSWENSAYERYDLPKQLKKGSFISDTMNIPVGYYIYIPDSYFIDSEKRFRTVYYLHGGRPGNEARSVYISKFLERNFTQTSLDPALYIFVNGGELSHYDSEEKNSFGEKVFIKELIPHIDKEYRTIAKRHARGLEGFSQGGRGATRYMFKYPELFGTVASGGASYAIERLIKENNGFEDDPRDRDEGIYFVGLDNDAWSLAKKHQESGKETPRLLLWSGTEDPNLPSIKEYKTYLDELKIDNEFLLAEEVDHNPFIFYEKLGHNLMNFHHGETDYVH